MVLNRYAYLAPVILRLALGAVFIVHGWPKLAHAATLVPFFARIGLPAPHAMVLMIGAVEVVGGLMLLAGIGTRIAAALLAANMLGAIVTTKLNKGFVGGWEYELVLMAAALSLVFSGPLGGREPARRPTD
ncbi:MAG TPA: DoxX family protein [Symbiobacteriaceae bacterium]|jgi:uncharacterized membrane protein YphA (DoxX/SURF4 family)